MSLAANASGSGTQTGGLLGMGVEYAFLPNWSAKLEYNYIDLWDALVQCIHSDECWVRRDRICSSFRSTGADFDYRE